jgi:hypothetical protein
LLFLFIALRQLDATPRSLYRASFIALAALSTLGRPEFFPWYFLWFIALGAIIGGWERDLSLLASAAGLLSYAVFPWAPNTPTSNLLFVLAVMVAPLAALGLLILYRRRFKPGFGAWRIEATNAAESSASNV